MKDFEKENAAAAEAIQLYARRLLEAFGNVPTLIAALRGHHIHFGTITGEDGKPCMVRATFELSDDCQDVLVAIATTNLSDDRPKVATFEFDLPRRKPNG